MGLTKLLIIDKTLNDLEIFVDSIAPDVKYVLYDKESKIDDLTNVLDPSDESNI
jgi:hypothetical protein